MGKLALGTALWLAAVGCGGPQEQGDPGAICFRDDECTYGLVCAVVGNGERTCTNNVSGLVATYMPEMPAAAGGAASGGTDNGGTSAGGAEPGAGGVVGAGGTEPVGGSASGGGGTPSGAGAPAAGGSAAGAPMGGAGG